MKKPAAPARPARKPPAKPAHHAKPPPPAKVPAKVRAARHAAAVKAARTRAANAAKARRHPKRKLALAGGVACCSAEALAASLRLAGHRVTDDDVLRLYWLTASGPDEGATIGETLDAAAEYGLAGVRPAGIRPGWPGFSPLDALTCDNKNPCVPYRRSADWPAGVLLGVTLPGGGHAVTLDPSGAVWSWGGLYRLPGIEIEEAWLIEWEIR